MEPFECRLSNGGRKLSSGYVQGVDGCRGWIGEIAVTKEPGTALSREASSRRWFPGQRQGARRDGSGLHDGGRGLPVSEELVEYQIQVVERLEAHLQYEAILSRDAVTLHDLGQGRGQLGNLRELAGHGTDADECGDGIAQGGSIDLEPAGLDDAGIFHALDALSGGRGR